MCGFCNQARKFGVGHAVPSETVVSFEVLTIAKGNVMSGQLQALEEIHHGSVKLGDVYEKYGKDTPWELLVIGTNGLRGEIFGCGNYGKGEWYKWADTAGYA
ncbi:hypothetical protein NHG29_01705 [Aerococcaceae bacterium NML160702]|nr:hypothetical protein [Aerococcaceae bacterium NML160702]